MKDPENNLIKRFKIFLIIISGLIHSLGFSQEGDFQECVNLYQNTEWLEFSSDCQTFVDAGEDIDIQVGVQTFTLQGNNPLGTGNWTEHLPESVDGTNRVMGKPGDLINPTISAVLGVVCVIGGVVYYLIYRDTQTLITSLGITGAGIIVLWSAFTARKKRTLQLRKKHGLCIECGYDLRGVSMKDSCPECGTPRRNPS